jgi:prepilin peptidase CpaA
MSLTPLPAVVIAALMALLVTAAVYDVRFRRIPNWLSVSGVIAGAALNAMIGPTVPGVLFALKGLGLGFSLYFVLYMLRAMGAGDVKLMGAVGALVGWQNWIGIFLATAILGGAAALAFAAFRGRLGKTLWNVGFILSEVIHLRPAYLRNEELDVRNKRSLGLPHGAIIAVAAGLFVVAGAYYAH